MSSKVPLHNLEGRFHTYGRSRGHQSPSSHHHVSFFTAKYTTLVYFLYMSHRGRQLLSRLIEERGNDPVGRWWSLLFLLSTCKGAYVRLCTTYMRKRFPNSVYDVLFTFASRSPCGSSLFCSSPFSAPPWPTGMLSTTRSTTSRTVM